MTPGRIRLLAFVTFTALFTVAALAGAHKPQVAQWTAEDQRGSHGPLPLTAGITYQAKVNGGCSAYPQRPAYLEVVERATGKVAWEGSAQFYQPRGTCERRAYTQEFQVPADGEYFVNWTIPLEVLPYHATFSVFAPVPQVYVYALFFGSLLAAGGLWFWAWAEEVWARNAVRAKEAADEAQRQRRLERINPAPDLPAKGAQEADSPFALALRRP